MPRPRKSRVAPSQPTATSSSATPPVIDKPTAKEPSSDIYDVSDREKERAKRAAAVATASRHMNSDQAKALEEAKQRRDQTMDRLVNMSSTTGTSNTNDNADAAARQSPRAPRRLTGDTSGLDLDDDMFDLDDSLEDPTITAQNVGGYRSANTSSFDVGLFQRHRPRQNSVSGRDDVPARPSSRGPTTPSIMSTLNLGMFKRRAREPSILGTAQKGRRQRSQSVTSQVSRIPVTDEEDNMDVDREAAIDDDDSGPDGESTPMDRAKRRSGASAFAGAVSGADITIPASSGAIPVEEEEEEECVVTGTPSQRSRKRKSLESHSGRNKRGRSSIHQQPEPEPEQEEEDDIIHQSIEMRDGSDSSMSSPLSTPGASPLLDPIQHSPPRQSRPPLDPNDPVNAPPASDSSEAGSPVAWPSLNNLTHRSYNSRRAAPVYTERLQTPELLPVLSAGPVAGGALDDDMSSELSSPPSLTHSPNYKAPSIAKAAAAAGAATKKAAAKKKEEERLATEALTSLLPARRNHASKSDKKKGKKKKGTHKENPYDISSDEDSSLSSSSEDETTAGVDELSYVATAAARRKKEKEMQHKEKGKQKKPPLSSTSNGKAGASKSSKSDSSEPKRTYGRASSDKENGASGSGDNDEEAGGDDQEPVSAMELDETEELPETTQMMTERLGEELQKAKKKFMEVDKWELSFEEVTRPSSPIPDAR
ncbi:hypothetical protein B0T20DRAFT_421914 [Sordaria brevicollis]|uniref:Uncharacterized protein n=1 Tax=Sordaria brevicollis TaxID=83679 RepID=A0AAE0U5E2_SORBR|nr:hypothetical protein B0T20DRAFT_421914 [Sordaria brevicollis]